MVKRSFDFFFALIFSIIFLIPLLLIGVIVKLTSEGNVLFWSNRIGKDNKIFKMPKFRSMYQTAPLLAPSLLDDPHSHITKVGRFLRKTSLDELPQLWSILRGDMSFVGPRPALFNEKELIDVRTSLGVHRLTPGLTGLAQINGRDHLAADVQKKAQHDAIYMRKQSFWFDIKIILITIWKVLFAHDITH